MKTGERKPSYIDEGTGNLGLLLWREFELVQCAMFRTSILVRRP